MIYNRRESRFMLVYVSVELCKYPILQIPGRVVQEMCIYSSNSRCWNPKNRRCLGTEMVQLFLWDEGLSLLVSLYTPPDFTRCCLWK